MGNNIPRRHHTVARFVLEGFEDGGRIDAWRRDGKRFPTSPRKATVINENYTFDTSEGERLRDVEVWLATAVERPAADVVRRLRAGHQPATDETQVLARLVATGLMRTASVRALLAQVDEHIGPTLVLAKVAADLGLDLVAMPAVEAERYRAVAADALSKAAVDQGERARSVLRTLLRHVDQLVETMNAWVWWTEYSDAPSFITSDAAVATLDVVQNGGWHGVVPAGSPVFMPMSPNCLLVGSPTRPLVVSDVAVKPVVGMVNATLAKTAYDAIYKHPGMDWPAGLQLASQRPKLAAPTQSIRRSQGPKPTFPQRYPPVSDASVAELLTLLEARDVVE